MNTKEIEEKFNNEVCSSPIFDDQGQEITQEVLGFLSTLRQSVLEEVSNGLPQDKRRSTRVRQDLTEFEEGFNDCLDQVTSLINNLIEGK